MPAQQSDRANIILDAEHRALADAIAERLGGGTRSLAIRYAIEQAAEALGIKRTGQKKKTK